MDAFCAPFWNLDQVAAWARSRSPAAVRFAENAPHLGKVNSDLSIEIKTNIEASRAKSAGRDIEAELWAASRQSLPVEADDLPNDMPTLHIEGREVLLESLRSPTRFPIEDYLLGLFRNGTLTAHGNLPGDPLARPISALDWGGLVIGVGGSLSRRGVWRANAMQHLGEGEVENVRIARAEVLRVFPAEPPTAEASQEAQPDPAQSSTPPIVRARRPRGPKADKGKMVLEAMRRDIEVGVDLENMPEKKMAEKYSAARDTCRKYRDIALAQTSANSDNYSANDK
jgi:hypothetical protein